MADYRDDRGAALARLEQLEEEHQRRLAESAPARRKLLDAKRFELVHPPASTRTFWRGLLRFGVLAITLVCIKGDNGVGFPIGLTIAAMASVALLVWFAISSRESRERARRIAEVDRAIAALDSIAVRVAPAELDAMHVRIAELEAEVQSDPDDANVSSASRRSR